MEAGGKIKGGNHWKVRDLDLDARSSTQQFYPGSPDSGMWWPSVKEKKGRITAIKSVPQNSNNEQRQYVSARVYIAGRLLLCALQARPSWLDVGFFQLLDQM